jgi:hypothetical protein
MSSVNQPNGGGRGGKGEQSRGQSNKPSPKPHHRAAAGGGSKSHDPVPKSSALKFPVTTSELIKEVSNPAYRKTLTDALAEVDKISAKPLLTNFSFSLLQPFFAIISLFFGTIQQINSAIEEIPQKQHEKRKQMFILKQKFITAKTAIVESFYNLQQALMLVLCAVNFALVCRGELSEDSKWSGFMRMLRFDDFNILKTIEILQNSNVCALINEYVEHLRTDQGSDTPVITVEFIYDFCMTYIQMNRLGPVIALFSSISPPVGNKMKKISVYDEFIKQYILVKGIPNEEETFLHSIAYWDLVPFLAIIFHDETSVFTGMDNRDLVRSIIEMKFKNGLVDQEWFQKTVSPLFSKPLYNYLIGNVLSQSTVITEPDIGADFSGEIPCSFIILDPSQPVSAFITLLKKVGECFYPCIITQSPGNFYNFLHTDGNIYRCEAFVYREVDPYGCIFYEKHIFYLNGKRCDILVVLNGFPVPLQIVVVDSRQIMYLFPEEAHAIPEEAHAIP